MFNFAYRTKLLISAVTIASAISGTAVVAEMKNPTVDNQPTEMTPAVDNQSAEMTPAVDNQPAKKSQMSATQSQQTIFDLASSSDSFKTLTSALEAADLAILLKGKGPFTVFAPTDKAFAALPEGTLNELLKSENKEKLVKILTYHVVPKEVMSTDLKAGQVTTVEGSKVTIALGDEVKVDQAQVLQADIKASNGVIHVIDQVIVPSN